MNWHMHTREIVLWRSYVHVLEPWDLLHFAIITVLAMFELRQHEALRSLQGLDPMDDSADSEHHNAQYSANCFRASSA